MIRGIHYLSTELKTKIDLIPRGCFNIDMKTLDPCNHTEADTLTCIFLHLAHAAYQGHKKAFVRTVDSDIVVLALSLFENVRLAELWIWFSTGKIYRHFCAYSTLTAKSLALPMFHSLTGCDTASHILSCGKKSDRNTWQNTPDRDIDCPY